jgi:Fe-S-cluster containining protein
MLETRIREIKRIAKEKQQENWLFRSMLKASKIPQQEIDDAAHAIYDKVKSEIDCTQCAYCCKHITPVVSNTDIKRIAKHLELKPETVIKKWFRIDKQMGMVIKSSPCPFLKNKKCSIYDARPLDCRNYPHLHKKKITNYFTTIFSHIDLCPQIFHFYEKMKRKYMKKLDKSKVTWL